MIRFVALSDAKAITDIYNKYIEHSTVTFETDVVSEVRMLHRIQEISSHFPYLVYEECGRVRGYCYAHAWKEREAYRNTLETTVYLAPGCQGKGIGRLLMEALIGECRRRGYHALVACITADNEASCALHEKLGFEQVSRFKEVGMKFGKWLDVVDYELLL